MKAIAVVPGTTTVRLVDRLEPRVVAEKAIDEAVRVQAARLPAFGAAPDWLEGRR